MQRTLTYAEKVLVYGARAWRLVAGDRSALEGLAKRKFRKLWRKEAGQDFLQWSNKNYLIIQSKQDPDPRVGIFLRGGCDLPAMFLMAPWMREGVKGTIAIARPPGMIGASHTRQLLQSLEDLPDEIVGETCHRLKLSRDFFRPILFQDTFAIQDFSRIGEFPKTVIILSLGTDLTRPMYRHREHGFLVDIGGWWRNQSMEKALQDLEAAKWFKSHFESVGRIDVDEFKLAFTQLMKEIRARVGAHVIVFNHLAVEPHNPVHNYQLLGRTPVFRRREFLLALAELSGELDFHIIDMDRVLKEQGVHEQVDFAHPSIENMIPLAQEGYRILKELEVI